MVVNRNIENKSKCGLSFQKKKDKKKQISIKIKD